MSLKCFLLLMAVPLAAWAATHDEMGRCGLSGIYKLRQNVLESPNYPGHYPPDTCWDYVVRSPYRCPTKFHIQFLDFYLESSSNCSNDYLAVGFENDGDDMDLLCGQVIGIKKYHTPGGVLRLRFHSDDSPWTTGKGFKLLVTRLACEREDLTRVSFRDVDDDSEHVDAPSLQLELPHHNRSFIFRNFASRNRDQYPETQSRNIGPQLQQPWNVPNPQQLVASSPFGFGGFYLPAALPVSQPPTTRRPAIQVRLDQPDGREKPCPKVDPSNLTPPPAQLPLYYNPFINQQPPVFNDQYINSPWTPEQQAAQPVLKAQQAGGKDSTSGQLGSTVPEPCCASSFRQQRLYLSSPGFPRTAFTSLLPVSQRDCQFDLEKTTRTVCLLRIEFKFFDFGQTFHGNGDSGGNVNIAIGTSRDVCTEDYVEIDGERFCGCRSGYVFTAPWGLGKKVIRMRMGYSGIPSNGFLLDIVQEECHGAQNGQQLQQEQQQPQGQIITGIHAGSGHQQQQQQQQQHGNRPNEATQFGIQQQQSFSIQPTAFGQQQQFYLPQSQPHHLQQLTGYAQQPLLYPQQLWNVPQVPYISPPHNQFGLPEYRRAKRLNFEPVADSSLHQPVTVVETNSTRKEYYYFDGDRAFERTEPPSQTAQRRTDQVVEGESENDGEIGVNRVNSKFFSREKNRCRFDMSDVLRLTVDVLWITKPTCYAPQRNWFGFLG